MVISMCKYSKKRPRGFVLIEALIALLIVSLGALAMAKLESLTLSAAGESRSRSEAMAITQQKMEELRNVVLQGQMPTGSCTLGADCLIVSGTNASYELQWTYTSVTQGTLISLTTRWTDRFSNQQALTLNSIVSWDNPLNQSKASEGFKGITAPSPSGDAKRGDYSLRKDSGGNILGTPQSGPGNVHIYENQDNNRRELLNSDGKVVLYLDDNAQFSTISGRIYFDDDEYVGNNGSPDSSIANIRVRLSSEGECFYDNTVGNLQTVTGTNSYHYFEYKCYVGSSWWGNVGLLIDNSVTGPLANPTICVGDPDFNGGVSNNTLTSAHPIPSNIRSYRGFTGTLTNGLCPGCLSTGVGPGRNMPNDGTVVPGTYATGSPANGAYSQHFLLTRLTGNETCNSKMNASQFASNAGKYYCISPDADTSNSDICPDVWPQFSVAGGGGVLNYTLTVNVNGTGQATGAVTSSPTGISCDSSASPTPCTSESAAFANGSVVTLTPSAPAGSTFTGWSGGGCSGTGICTVTISGNVTVTANFHTGTTANNLTVAISPTGSGTVTSNTDSDGDGTPNINCPTDCSHDYTESSTTLTATPATGYTFTGWSGGGCSGTGACTVTITSAQLITASFAVSPVTYTLSVTKSGTGTGTVTASAAGISCGSTCSANLSSGTAVTLSAAQGSGSTFTQWTIASGETCTEGSNTATTCTVTMSAAKSVNAAFYTDPCTTTIAGSRESVAGTVSIVTPNNSGSCTNDSTGVGYSCNLSTAPNATIKLKDQLTGSGAYNNQKTITANCLNNSNVNFP